MATETRKLICTNCGKEIEVPAELESFSCLYCGEKLRMKDLAAPSEKADTADLEYVEAHLFDCIRDYPNYFKNFNRKKYETTFHTYQYGIEETYQAMNRFVVAQPQRRTELLQSFVDRFLQEWKEFHAHSKKSKAAREKEMFADKLTLAWYTVPAIRALELSVSEDYTELLQKEFVAAYPDNPFKVASYYDLASGFRKHGICFITTAVCAYEGKPDDCAELTAFRAFRDGWLSETAEGRELIEAYYEVAPAIVLAIDYCGQRDRQYEEIRHDYLSPCYEALCAGDYAACKSHYVSMVEHLKKTYLFS